MKILNVVFVFVLLIGATSFVSAQNTNRSKAWRVSDAYTVLVKEKASAKANLYEAEHRWTAETPQVKIARLRLALLNREMKKLAKTTAPNANKFSAAYGNLILAKVQTEIELFGLRETLMPEHISIKKKEVELASLNSDLNQIDRSFR